MAGPSSSPSPTPVAPLHPHGPPARRGPRPAHFPARSRKLLSTAGIADFTITDLANPDPRRLRVNLSALINFAKFREEKLVTYVEFTKETDELQAQKQQHEEVNERLLTSRNAAREQRAADAPEVARLSAENQHRQAALQKRFRFTRWPPS